MLRAKEPLVNDLQKAILQGIRPYNQSLEAAPIDPGIYQVFWSILESHVK